jgi:hypothetical protein
LVNKMERRENSRRWPLPAVSFYFWTRSHDHFELCLSQGDGDGICWMWRLLLLLPVWGLIKSSFGLFIFPVVLKVRWFQAKNQPTADSFLGWRQLTCFWKIEISNLAVYFNGNYCNGGFFFLPRSSNLHRESKDVPFGSKKNFVIFVWQHRHSIWPPQVFHWCLWGWRACAPRSFARCVCL